MAQPNNVTLTWNPQSWAIGYQVQITGTGVYPDTSYPTITLPAGTWQTTTTLQDGTYGWRVCGIVTGTSCTTYTVSERLIVE